MKLFVLSVILLLGFTGQQSAAVEDEAGTQAHRAIAAGYGLNLDSGEILSPAHLASRLVEPCANGGVCLYANPDGTGLLVRYTTSQNGCRNLPSAANDKTSYVWNNSTEQWFVYTGNTCTGTSGPIYASSQGQMTGGYNNTISSIYGS